MKRRQFLTSLAAGTVISTADWLGYFRRFGVPGTQKDLGLAEAAAQATMEPRFLVYWFQEGGWDGYSMFNPLDTRNDATLTIPMGELHPNPDWSTQYYRPMGYGMPPNDAPTTTGNIVSGFLTGPGRSLFPDLAVVSSHYGSEFHSGGRWEYHYGNYSYTLGGQRQPDERTVIQAFCEAYGSSYLMPHISWHRWLSDGELAEANYPDGTGYFERLGPAYAHTAYGKTPTDMRARLSRITSLTSSARDARIRLFVDNLHRSLVADKNGPSVRAFASAVEIHRGLVGAGAVNIQPNRMFTDPALRAEFGVAPGDEDITFTSVNGNPARSKESPNTNVQAMMTYELMTLGLSCGFFIENRSVRGFDTHASRRYVIDRNGQPNQLADMTANLWTPLKTFVDRLKSTQYQSSGKSYYDLTTIVLASEMGRTIQGNVSTILSSADPPDSQYTQILDQDVSQHWHVNSCAFLGGSVQGNRQWGRVGTVTQDAIPIRADGSLDPAYDPVTGVLRSGQTKDPNSFVTDAGHVYATALYLSGLDPDALRAAHKGRNNRPPLRFIKR
ncbi:MAG: hypothetical protein U1E65_35040 [Myxococcota bacterium]